MISMMDTKTGYGGNLGCHDANPDLSSKQYVLLFTLSVNG